MKTNNSKPQQVLLIEDDSFFQILCGYYLNLLGYQKVDIVSSAEEALTKTLQDYALIISDFNLGKGLNGAQFAKQAYQQTGKRLPIMLISSGQDEAIFQAIQSKAAQTFLAKPFTFTAFKKTISCLIKANKPKDKLNKVCSAHKIKFFYHRYLKPELQKSLYEYFPDIALPQKALVLVKNSLQQNLLVVTLKQQGFIVSCSGDQTDLNEALLKQVNLILVDQYWEKILLNKLQHENIWRNKPKLFLLSNHEHEDAVVKANFDAIFKLNCLVV